MRLQTAPTGSGDLKLDEKEELLDTLKITLAEMLEINREEAINLTQNGYQAVAIQL